MKSIHAKCFGLVMGWMILLSAGQASAEIKLSAGGSRVGQFEKIEFRIELPVATAFKNPCDPEEVDLSLAIETPSGKTVSLPAFYIQPYEYRQIGGGKKSDWFYPAGAAGWRARFAPQEAGHYRCHAILKTRRGASEAREESNAVSFECAASDEKGFVRVARRNPRYYEYSTGGAFFPIGQDLAFIGDSQYVSVGRTGEIFGKMAQNGANFTRIWTCCGDWAMGIETRKSAWGRSWEKKSRIVEFDSPGTGPKRKIKAALIHQGEKVTIAPSHQVALRPGTHYTLSGDILAPADGKISLELGGRSLGQPSGLKAGVPAGWSREFTTGPGEWWLAPLALRLDGATTACLAGITLQEGRGGTNLLWEADPNRPARGDYNPLDCAMLDQVVAAAEKSGIKLQLCLLSRDLYMNALKNPASAEYDQAIRDAKKTLRYAVARWGYSTAVAAWEYWNEENPGLPTDRFYAEAGKYLTAIDPYRHLRVTSAWGPAEKDWRHPELDAADLHHYLRSTWGPLWRDEVAAVADRAAFLLARAPGRPALLSEFGLADDKWGLSLHMREDAALGHFHNALWASALSGLAGTAMFWWWESLDRQDAYRHYRGVAAFTADIPFATETLAPAEAKASDARVRAVGLKTRERADLWLSSSEAAWGRRILDKQAPTEIRDATLELHGLAPGDYEVQWWDTATGKVIKREKVHADADKSMQCPVPPFTTDIACKVGRFRY